MSECCVHVRVLVYNTNRWGKGGKKRAEAGEFKNEKKFEKKGGKYWAFVRLKTWGYSICPRASLLPVTVEPRVIFFPLFCDPPCHSPNWRLAAIFYRSPLHLKQRSLRLSTPISPSFFIYFIFFCFIYYICIYVCISWEANKK